jgi:hypothetical protein
MYKGREKKHVQLRDESEIGKFGLVTSYFLRIQEFPASQDSLTNYSFHIFILL